MAVHWSPATDYMLRILDFRGEPIHREFVSLRNPALPIEVRLPPPDGAGAIRGVISLDELRRRVPAMAGRLLIRSQRAFRTG